MRTRAILTMTILASTAMMPIAAAAADPVTGARVMTVAQAEPGDWGAVPEVGLRPPRGGGWGPEGYRDGDAAIPDVPSPSVAETMRPDYADGDDDRVYAGDARDERSVWNDDRRLAGRDYRPIGRGDTVPGNLRTPTYAVENWRGYGLGRPGYGQYWIRYYEDALLIDGRGRVIDSRYDIDWDRAGPPPRYAGDGYDGGAGDPNGGVQVYRSGPNAPNVSVSRNPDGSTTVVVRNEPQTTTTTTYYDEPAAPARRTPRRR